MTATPTSKLYVLSYHEVQIAGYRIFSSYTDALKEYLKHCILETKSLLAEDDQEADLAVVEELYNEEEASELSESAEEDTESATPLDNDADKSEDEDEDEFDEMSAVLEVQELQDNEYVTIKEYDYDAFQILIDGEDDVQEYMDELEKNIELNQIPTKVLELFKQ